MVRINKQEIKGITGERKCTPIAEADNIINIEEEDNICCNGEECHIDWQEP